jgi:hypothetical protein
VYGLQVCKFIVVRINAYAEEEAGIATVYDLVISELGGDADSEPTIKDGRNDEVCPPPRNWIDISGRGQRLTDVLRHADGAIYSNFNTELRQEYAAYLFFIVIRDVPL